jgi:hypothetical protein
MLLHHQNLCLKHKERMQFGALEVDQKHHFDLNVLFLCKNGE